MSTVSFESYVRERQERQPGAAHFPQPRADRADGAAQSAAAGLVRRGSPCRAPPRRRPMRPTATGCNAQSQSAAAG